MDNFNNGKKYMQFFDNHGIEMLASDSIMYFDNRLNNINALNLAYKKIQKQAAAYETDNKRYVKPRACYVCIMRRGQRVTEPASLDNPLF